MIKKNYIQTILSNNPQRFFTFAPKTNFVKYNGESISGGFYDEYSGSVLTPHFTMLIKNPKEIYLNGPSVIENEPNNQSLNVGGGDINDPYNLYFISNDTQDSELGSSISFNFNVPKQDTNKIITITDYVKPYAIIEDFDTKEKITVIGMMYGSYFYIPIKDHIKDIISFNIKIYYMGYLYHDAYYEIDDTQFFKNNNIDYYKFSEGNEPLFDTKFSLTESNNDNSLEFMGVYSKRLVNSQFKKVPYIENKTIVDGVNAIKFHTLYNKDSVFYGKFNDIVRVNSFNTKVLDIYSTVKLVKINGWTFEIRREKYNTLVFDVYSVYDNFYVKGIELYITENTNYFFTMVKWDNIATFYLNGEFKGQTTGKLSPKSLVSSQLQLGEPSYFSMRYNYVEPNFNDELIYNSNNNVTFIDNVAIYNKVLDSDTIFLMYIRTLTYKSLIYYFNPIFYIEFTKPLKQFNNVYGSDKLVVNNFTTNSVNTKNDLFSIGINFKGMGSLLHKNNSDNYSQTTSLINLSNDFSIMFGLVCNSDCLLYSERNKSNPLYGLSVFVKYGYLFLEFGGNVLQTKCLVKTNSFQIFCISYNSIKKELSIFNNKNFNETYKNIIIYNNNEFPTYATLFNDKIINDYVDVTLVFLGIYNRFLEYTLFNIINTQRIEFTLEGTILHRNLPANAIVRLIDHYSGELLDTVKTDKNGEFTYTNIYKQEYDIIILNNNKINVNGILESNTR